MRSKKLAGKKPKASTQRYIDIAQIQDDIVIMKDGSLRAVLLTSSINFSLKSEDEQNATINSYISFLNSLSFPLQIVIQSRRLNIDKYLEDLEKREREQVNELLRAQTAEYRQFVGELIKLAEIMSKRFYVVVPYVPGGDKQKGFFQRAGEIFSPATVVTLKREKFLERRQSLMQRVNLVTSGLQGMGLNSLMLNTNNLIELYYDSYNPVLSESQKLKEVENMQVEYAAGGF